MIYNLLIMSPTSKTSKPASASAKSRQLRPVKIALAVLTVALFILIFNALPVKEKSANPTEQQGSSRILSADEIREKSASPEAVFYVKSTDLLSLVEAELEARLLSLGVPEDEFENASAYLSPDELYMFETKTDLASALEATYTSASFADLERLLALFSLTLDSTISTGSSDSAPYLTISETLPADTECEPLSTFLDNYDTTLNTVEDYDEVVVE